jgi:hypothetical protein
MKINEILTESDLSSLKEGPIGAVGRGIAKGIGGLAKGAGMIAGIGRGVKSAYQKGKATSAAHIAGDVPKVQDPEAQSMYDKEYARLTTKPNPNLKTGMQSIGQKLGIKGGTQTAAKGLGQVAQGQAVSGQMSQAIAPFIKPLEKILADPALRQKFNTLAQQAQNSDTAQDQPDAAEQPAKTPAPNQSYGKTTAMPTNPAAAPGAGTNPQPTAKSAANPAAAPVDDELDGSDKHWDTETGEPKTPQAKAEYDTFTPAQKSQVEKLKAQKAARAQQSEIDADRQRVMGQTSDSIIRGGPAISEGFSLYRRKR